MKKLKLLILFFFVISYSLTGQEIIELDNSQSMSITGKGPGQDAAINPFSDTNSIAIVENIGENNFVIRLQKKNEVVKMIPIKPYETKKIKLLKGYELYFDSKLKSKAKVEFKRMSKKSKTKQ